MIVIVCVDNRFGMLFNHKRQSQDHVLRERILQLTAGAKLWMNDYTKKQFHDMDAPQIYVDAVFLDKAEQGTYCFVEDVELLPYEADIERIILYKWNRTYPADLHFSIPLREHGWKLIQMVNFEGSSHETITEEIYCK